MKHRRHDGAALALTILAVLAMLASIILRGC